MSYSRLQFEISNFKFEIIPWAEQGSNLRTRERTDLQSVAFNHSAICPKLCVSLKCKTV